MMDPLQLQMMQQAGLLGNQLGLPGMFAPGLQGGIGNLSALSMSGGYGMPIRGGTFPDVSPLAPLGLQNFGLFGTLASMAGNTYVASMFQQNGIIPMGNAGSFSQAQRANQFRNMQNAVSSEIAQADSDSFYATMKGIAALTGQPFDREQREAARSLSDTLASFGPTIAMFNPEILDAVAGPTGSVQAMAAQMMQANRFRVDPNTGRMGYGEEANTQLIRQLFDELYSRDEMAQMNGIRAGEAGQLYKELSSRGLLSRRGSLRERTIDALKQADNLGQLEQVGAEADVDVTGELDALSFEQLDKLRQTSTVRKLLNSSDVDNIKRQLRGYSDSIAAIREVFGENGNPNAPIPQLIGALEALTSGQMHKFDAAKLNLMVRDMQALSQMSGKSIDQMLAMNQGNTAYLQQVGLGPHAAMFAPTATNVGVAHGMAFADQAGATGFGALNRQQAEQAASRMFARGMASEAGNLYATLGRISNAGGFDETTAAGRRLKAIHDAAYNQQTTYIDPETGEEKRLPTREAEVRGLINQGAAVGMGMEDFNLMLGDRTSNLRMQAEDENYATIAMNQQAGELSRVSQRDAANRLSSALPLRVLDAESRNVAAREMSGAALEALQNLTPQEQQNRELRQRAMADAIQRAALNNGVTLSDSEAETLAANTYGSFENTAVNKFGFESATAAAQVMGDQVVEARTQRTVQAKARAQMNDAMSELGPDGTITQRAFDAIQRQGERGEEANLDTLLTDMFGVEDLEARDKIIPELQAVANEKEAIEKLQEKLNDPTLSQAERAELSSEIQRRTAELKERNIEIRESARELGYDSGEGSFGRDDVRTAEKAAEEMEQLNRLDQARLLGLEGAVTEDEREDIKDERITREDVYAIAESRRKEDLQRISELTAEDIETYSTKVDEIEKLKKRLEEEGVDEGIFDFTGLDPDEIEAIQKEIDQKTAEIIGLSPEIQQEYNKLKEVYGEEVALKRVKELVTSEVGTVDELAEDIAFELGDSINRVGLLAQEDQDAVVRSRRSDEARIPNANAIAKRAAELRESSDREEIRRRQDLAGDQSKEARHQLLAESQLRALGMLEEGQTLHASSEEIEKYERLPEELKEALVDTEVSDRADIVDKFIDSQIEQKFYGTEQEREENRVAAIEYLQSDEGERAIEEHKVNFEKMVDLRRELMADPEAIKRLGSARAVEAIDQSRSAEMGLQEMANRYGFNGSVEAMLVSDFLASDAAGMETIEKEFGELSQEDKESIAEGLRETGLEVSAADLTVSDYQVHLRNQMKGYVEEIKESNQTMRGAADNKQRAEELGVTEEQLASIEKLAELEKDIETDAEESAEKIGISEQEYWDMATGAQEFDENLRLFKGEDAAEQLLEAKGAEKTISDAKERLDRIEESIAEVEASGGTSEALMIVKAEQEQIIKDAEETRAEKMKAAGFDPSKQEDVDRYTQLLDHQGDVSLLEERSKNYQQAREELKAEGKTDEEITAVVDKMIADDKAADEKIAELKKYDISASDVKLAEALGIDTTTTSEELKEFKSLIKEHAGTSDASQRTQEMVADALDEVDKLEGLEGEDAFQKLDNLTDEYNKASPTERKAIAHKYGMAEDELDHLMRKTEFLGLENLDLSDMGDKEKQEVLAEGLERVMGRDIEAEVKQEEERQMKLTGTVNLTGVVQGEGTFDDVTGATVR